MKAELFNIDTALLTSRTVVRRFRESEGENFYELIQNNQTLLIDHFPHMVQRLADKEIAEFYIREKLVEWLQHREFVFGVWNKESAKMIGYISLFEIDWEVPSARVTYFIDREHSGKGIMTEALWAVVRFAFQQLKMEKLYSRMAADNFASQRLARKCGFRREGDLRSAFRKYTGDLIDLILLGLTRAEFEKT
jgi:RimJ/RimL family protein N-acetyltransferase